MNMRRIHVQLSPSTIPRLVLNMASCQMNKHAPPIEPYLTFHDHAIGARGPPALIHPDAESMRRSTMPQNTQPAPRRDS